MRSAPADEAARAYRRGAVFLDIRSRAAHRRDGLDTSRSLPLQAIQGGALPEGVLPDQPVYLVCERGLLSELAGLYLEQAGYFEVHNVLGGLRALRPLL